MKFIIMRAARRRLNMFSLFLLPICKFHVNLGKKICILFTNWGKYAFPPFFHPLSIIFSPNHVIWPYSPGGGKQKNMHPYQEVFARPRKISDYDYDYGLSYKFDGHLRMSIIACLWFWNASSESYLHQSFSLIQFLSPVLCLPCTISLHNLYLNPGWPISS